MTDEMGGGSGYSDLLLPQLDLSTGDNIFIVHEKESQNLLIYEPAENWL